ncbi:MAG: FtsW/RodA/SpoVE family cell cycle protein [Anaerolineales bacterium]|nr:FtsW/RodA/SpoVE family cell cycle protein [Anaerolineales bacterium]MDW8160481.1 FtsW/RodA/SpoVE family cell cycle protein [Anaerolineales bacterium]
MLPKMGHGFVKETPPPTPNRLRQWLQRNALLRLDLPLILVCAALLLFGLMMIYSASAELSFYYSATRDLFAIYGIFLRQVLALMVALAAAPVVVLVDYHAWKPFVLPAAILVILMLLLVLFIGESRFGARRGLLGGSYQPAELAKLITVIYVAFWLDGKKETLQEITFGLIPLVLILGIMSAFILLQPDYSAVLTILAIGGMLFFLAGGDWKQILLFILSVFSLGVLIILLTETGRNRVMNWIQGISDPTLAPYQVQRALEAFYKGGLFGVGLGNSVTKSTGLPTPQSDSIFAIVGEEFGLVGTTLLIGLYLVILWRGLAISQRAPDSLGALLAAGMTSWIVMEALINMAQIVNLIPFTGNALPFISAGGSNLVVSIFAIATILNVGIRSDSSKELQDDLLSKVVNLRRWDRRWRLPRSRRAPGAKR